MKRLLVISLAISLAAVAAFGQKAQWDGGKQEYKLESGAKIRVGVDSDAWGAAIVALWNKSHPEATGAVEYVNLGSTGATDQITQLQEDAPDVCLVIDSEVGRNAQSLLDLDPVMANVAKKVAQEPFFTNANSSGTVKYVPAAYNFMCFAWNKTMLEKLGLSTSVTNKDGLPDAFNTWEKIFALAKEWQAKRPQYNGKPVNIVFPMCLDEPWSAYSNVTAGGWEIFKEGDTSKPGFEKSEFRDGLDFIKAASEAEISVEANGTKTPAASMTWRWDDALNNQTSPFFLAGTWMDIAKAEKSSGSVIKFSALPTWKGKHLTPFVATKGFAINGFTKYPSAAHELFRLLYTKAGMEAMVAHSSYIPALKAKSPISPDIAADTTKFEMAEAVIYNYPEPSKTLPNNKFKKGLDAYYDIGMNLIYRSVWDGEKTPAAGQADAVRLFNNWFTANNK